MKGSSLVVADTTPLNKWGFLVGQQNVDGIQE